MKYLKLFENYNKEDIDSICREYGIKNYTINDDSSIDVDDNVDLSSENLTKLPLKFNKVNGYFNCSENNLTSLEGCPKEVGLYFDCSINKLTSLVGCSERVSGSFYCECNKLTSLIGGPERVGSDFWCGNNKIRDFDGFPKSLSGYFNCDYNPVYRVWELFENKDKIELFNDYDIIRDNVIIMGRLNDFLMEIGKPTINKVERYKCI